MLELYKCNTWKPFCRPILSSSTIASLDKLRKCLFVIKYKNQPHIKKIFQKLSTYSCIYTYKCIDLYTIQ